LPFVPYCMPGTTLKNASAAKKALRGDGPELLRSGL
jgi:hypothetical protein